MALNCKCVIKQSQVKNLKIIKIQIKMKRTKKMMMKRIQFKKSVILI